MFAKHNGSCHCESVMFEVAGEFSASFICNCSFCSRRGATMVKVASNSFELLNGSEVLTSYGNSGFSKHQFCSVCGIQCYTLINKKGLNSVAINIACISGVDWSGVEVVPFDGAGLL